MSTLITDEFAKQVSHDNVQLYRWRSRWELTISRGGDPQDGLPCTVLRAIIMTEEQFHELFWIMSQAQCRVCGCTQDDCQQCVEKTGDACEWVEADLCSACVDGSRVKSRETRAGKKKPAKKRGGRP